MEPKLSLLARKDIKAHEEKVKEALERIQAVVELPAEPTLDVNYAQFSDFLTKKGTTNGVGGAAYAYVEGMAGRMEYTFKDEAAKSALQAAWTTGVLRIQGGVKDKKDTSYGYTKTEIDNGDLVVTVYDYCNVSDVGTDLLGKLGDSSTGLPVKAVQNIKENEEKRAETLQAIQANLQLAAEVTLDVDWNDLGTKAERLDGVGDIAQAYIEAIESLTSYKFKNDEVAREALAAAWTTGVLKIEWGVKKKNDTSYGYAATNIVDGNLVVTVYSYCNVSDTGSDLIDKLSAPDSGLPLKAALSWKNTAEERQELLAAIQEQIQLSSEVTVDVDLSDFGTKLKQLENVGSAVNAYVEALKSRFDYTFVKDDIARSALQAAWTTGVIRIEHGVKAKKDTSYGYSATNIRDGDLVVTVYDYCNVSDTATDLLEKLGDPTSSLPLKTAQNIAEYAEKRDENLRAIQEALGLSSEVTIDADMAALSVLSAKNGYEHRIGEILFDGFLGALASRFKRFGEDEMVKEAVAESFSTGVIRIENGGPKLKSYHTCDFVNGDLVVKFREGSMYTNISDIGDDIEGKL